MTTPFQYHVRVGYADTDRMGFVHHSRFLVYMESARTEMLRAGGDSYHAWEDRGILLPVTEVQVSYHKPALYDDMLRIDTVIEEVTRLRLRFRYEVYCDERIARIATGMTSHVFMNKEGRPTRVAEDVIQKLKHHTQRHQNP
ncbi:thioesterase family protein [soil metagenome]